MAYSASDFVQDICNAAINAEIADNQDDLQAMARQIIEFMGTPQNVLMETAVICNLLEVRWNLQMALERHVRLTPTDTSAARKLIGIVKHEIAQLDEDIAKRVRNYNPPAKEVANDAGPT